MPLQYRITQPQIKKMIIYSTMDDIDDETQNYKNIPKVTQSSSESNKFIDITTMTSFLEVEMSIDNVYTSGFVEVIDRLNIFDTFKFKGQEYIEIEFNAYDNIEEKNTDVKQKTNVSQRPFHRIFFITDIVGMLQSPKTTTYKLVFVDVLALVNQDYRLSIQYNMKTEEILQNIKTILETKNDNEFNISKAFNNYKKITNHFKGTYYSSENELFPFADIKDVDNVRCVNTKYDIDIKIPNKNPVETIKYLVEHSVSSDQDIQVVPNIVNEYGQTLGEFNGQNKIFDFADCVFYQDRKGKYILSSYKKMFTEPYVPSNGTGVAEKYVIGGDSLETMTFKKVINNENGLFEESYRVISTTFDTYYNIHQFKDMGIYGCTLSVVDLAQNCGYIEEITHENILSAFRQYIGQNENLRISGGNYFPVPFYKSTNAKCIDVVCGADSSKRPTISYNNNMSRAESFELPYWRGQILKTFMRTFKLVVEVGAVTDIDIGVPVILNLGKQTHSNIENPTDTIQTVFEGFNTIWVVNKVTHIFTNPVDDGSENSGSMMRTRLELFSPFLNINIPNIDKLYNNDGTAPSKVFKSSGNGAPYGDGTGTNYNTYSSDVTGTGIFESPVDVGGCNGGEKVAEDTGVRITSGNNQEAGLIILDTLKGFKSLRITNGVDKFRRLNPEMAARVCKFAEEFEKEFGEKLTIVSSWRSYYDQERVYLDKVAKFGSNQKVAASPGTSLHSAGTAIDVDRSQLDRIISSGKESTYLSLASKCGLKRSCYHPERGKDKDERWHFEMYDESGKRELDANPKILADRNAKQLGKKVGASYYRGDISKLMGGGTSGGGSGISIDTSSQSPQSVTTENAKETSKI